MNLENEFDRLETTLIFLYSKMALLVDDNEAVQFICLRRKILRRRVTRHRRRYFYQHYLTKR